MPSLNIQGKKKKDIYLCSSSGVSRVTSAVVRTHNVVTISVVITAIAVVLTLVMSVRR